MTTEQAKLLKHLAQETYEPQAFKRNLTQAEASRRIATLDATESARRSDDLRFMAASPLRADISARHQNRPDGPSGHGRRGGF
jgi:hypothetical protein